MTEKCAAVDDAYGPNKIGIPATLEKYGISCDRTLRKWKKKYDQNRVALEMSKKSNHEQCRKRECNVPSLDKVLREWTTKFLDQHKISLNLSLIRRKALSIKNQLLNDNSLDLSHKEKTELRRFNASRKWSIHWTQAFGLVSKRLHGEAGSVNVEALRGEIEELKAYMGGFDDDHIYNMDETGLFYRLLPKTSYVAKENSKGARGTKAMNQKDRLTVCVCTNLTGTQKVELAIIGKSNKPMCFKNLEGKDKPIPYFSQKNAWSDKVTFEKWFKEVFLPHMRKHIPDP